jgi:type IV secretion system protein VirD4
MARVKKKMSKTAIIIYASAIVIAVYLCALFGACLDKTAAESEQNSVDFTAAFNMMTSEFLNIPYVFMQSITENSYAQKLVIMGAMSLGIYILLKASDSRKLHRRGEEHGSAKWASAREAKQLADNVFSKSEVKIIKNKIAEKESNIL